MDNNNVEPLLNCEICGKGIFEIVFVMCPGGPSQTMCSDCNKKYPYGTKKSFIPSSV